MPLTNPADDALSHINPEGSTGAQATAASGNITVLSIVQISWNINGDSMTVSAVLQTPVGCVNLGTATLSPQSTTATLGGSIAGFKAEVVLKFDFSNLVLQISGTVCSPFTGCISGHTSVHM